MPIRCPHCGKQYDVTAFLDGKEISCSCGQLLHLSDLNTVEDFLRFFESEEERKKAGDLSREAEAICQMILNERMADVDIRIAMENLKQKAATIFPDRIGTYEMIYEARFNRLWEQFRRET